MDLVVALCYLGHSKKLRIIIIIIIIVYGISLSDHLKVIEICYHVVTIAKYQSNLHNKLCPVTLSRSIHMAAMVFHYSSTRLQKLLE